MNLRRGAVDIQFNWMFVLISGVVLLILFTGIIIRERNISDENRKALDLKNLDFVLSGFEIRSGTSSTVKLHKEKFEFGCGSYAIGSASKQLNAMSVFTPSVLESDNFASTTLGWKMPYLAANIVYLTNQKIRYIFIGDSVFAREVFEMMPEETNNDGYTSSQAIQDENDPVVRLIFFEQEPKIPEGISTKTSKVTALKVTGGENKGDIEFFNFANGEFKSEGKSYYLGKPALLGAIFTDNIKIYECAMKNLFKNLNKASQVYELKAANLKNYYEHQQCEKYYSMDFITAIKESSNSFSQPSINEIDEAARNLEIQNKNAQEQSCTLIY